MNKKDLIVILETMQELNLITKINDLIITPSQIITALKNWIYHPSYVENFFIPKQFIKQYKKLNNTTEKAYKKMQLQKQYETAWKIFE